MDLDTCRIVLWAGGTCTESLVRRDTPNLTFLSGFSSRDS